MIKCGAGRGMRSVATGSIAVLVLLGLAAAGPVYAKSQGHREARPNIVVIQADDAVIGDLRFMPKVQRHLVRQGTDFTDFFNSYPLCCPARTTLMTGQFSHNHQVLSNFQSNDGGYYTFSSLPGKLNQRNSLGPWLQKSGYRTAMVGKYLNEYGALDRKEVPPGWDQWAVLLDNSTYDYFNYAMNINGKVRFWGDRDYAKQQLKLARLGATDPPESFAELLALFQEAFVPYDSFGSQRPGDYTMDTNGRYAARFVRRAAPSKRPFFLYYAPPGPHAEDTNHAQGLRPGAPEPDPRPPYRYRNTFDDVPLPKPPSFNEADVSDKAANIRSLPKLTPEQIAEIADNYRGRLGALRAVDDQVGRILRQLRRARELRNTYIIFNSDNGYLQGEHRLRSSKYLPFENSIRVPTVIRGPAVQARPAPRGQRDRCRPGADDSRHRRRPARPGDGRDLAAARCPRQEPAAPARRSARGPAAAVQVLHPDHRLRSALLRGQDLALQVRPLGLRRERALRPARRPRRAGQPGRRSGVLGAGGRARGEGE